MTGFLYFLLNSYNNYSDYKNNIAPPDLDLGDSTSTSTSTFISGIN